MNLLQESGKTDKNKSSEVTESDIMKLTTSETRRNIGEFMKHVHTLMPFLSGFVC